MFKSFKAISEFKVEKAKELYQQFNVWSKLKDAYLQVMSSLDQVAATFARQYALVQQTEYDSEGHLNDVTSADRQTVPYDALASAKVSIAQAKADLWAISPEAGDVVIPVTVPEITETVQDIRVSNLSVCARVDGVLYGGRLNVWNSGISFDEDGHYTNSILDVKWIDLVRGAPTLYIPRARIAGNVYCVTRSDDYRLKGPGTTVYAGGVAVEWKFTNAGDGYYLEIIYNKSQTGPTPITGPLQKIKGILKVGPVPLSDNKTLREVLQVNPSYSVENLGQSWDFTGSESPVNLGAGNVNIYAPSFDYAPKQMVITGSVDPMSAFELLKSKVPFEEAMDLLSEG